MGAGLVGASVARAWANRGHQVALVPQAAAGAGIGGAVTDLLGAGSGILVVTDPHPGTETSTALGEALAEACDARPDQVWVDLATSGATDAGAGLVRVLGRTGADARLAEALAAARERLGSVRLLGVVPTEQVINKPPSKISANCGLGAMGTVNAATSTAKVATVNTLTISSRRRGWFLPTRSATKPQSTAPSAPHSTTSAAWRAASVAL